MAPWPLMGCLNPYKACKFLHVESKWDFNIVSVTHGFLSSSIAADTIGSGTLAIRDSRCNLDPAFFFGAVALSLSHQWVMMSKWSPGPEVSWA